MVIDKYEMVFFVKVDNKLLSLEFTPFFPRIFQLFD